MRWVVRRHPGWSAAIVLVAASFALLLWAQTRPSFDAYGWLVWGHQAVGGTLNTNAAPSWKPLPFVFTAPYALFGGAELWLWMLTAASISLGGAIFAGRIAYRLTSLETRVGSWAPTLAAVFAAASLLVVQGWWHNMLSAQSDTLILALCLGAADRHLSGHPRCAYTLGALASLGRPEVWPLLALYAIWAWRSNPSMRRLIVIGLLAIAGLWFGVPALTSRSPFVAAANAFGSGRRPRHDQVGAVLHRFLALEPAPLELAALLSFCWAAIRRDWTVLGLGASALLWVIVEIAFALHGWPGLGRYMYGAAGLMAVIAATLVGRLLVGAAGPVNRRPCRRAAGRLQAALAVALIAGLVPTAISRARDERHDLRLERRRTTEIDRLRAVVDRLGGPARVRACGEPLTRLEYQTVLAWTLGLNVAAVGYKYPQALAHRNPVVFFTPLPAGGWHVHALRQRSTACSRPPV